MLGGPGGRWGKRDATRNDIRYGARRCVGVGQGGLVIATADGGITWGAIPSAVALGGSLYQDVACPDARHCVAVGEDGSIAQGPAGLMGEPWHIAYPAGGVPLLTVSCANALRCVALGIPAAEKCVILATGDGGRTWRRRFAN